MKVENFKDFFHGLHGRSPFPWQERLAREVCTTNSWPRVIDLPTGSGKTACIDIALFHLLVAAAKGEPRLAARRIAFVVDRRVIVDEAAERAAHIAKALAIAKEGVLHRAAGILAEVTGRQDSNVLDVIKLRGGTPRDANLVHDPRSVAIVLSTVDQLGSRLLFRGYGVSGFAHPMHAGLFGFDTLVLLDEAHIAEPFCQTLEGIEREQGRATDGALGAQPLRWSQLSATPKTTPNFSLDAADRADGTLRRRLEASKPMKLVSVDKRDGLPKQIVKLVEEELALPSMAVAEAQEGTRIGVVLNRVLSARAVYAELVRSLGTRADVRLLIGRTRPLDRDRLMEQLSPLLKSSSAGRPGDRPIIVVATQTIEVGADFDFHAMFVEAASYPAIKQRLGRLNRLGLRPGARGAIVLVQADASNDPIYGDTIATTWSLLKNSAQDDVVDLGISRAPAPTEDTAPSAAQAPLLTPALVGLFTQTSPRPAVEPEVSAFLHGFGEPTSDVSVVWRDGLLRKSELVPPSVASALLDRIPPLSLETMSLPVFVLRSWLQAREDKKHKYLDLGDVEGAVATGEEKARKGIKVFVVNAEEGVELVGVERIRPGATVLLPSEWGGADEFGFSPDSSGSVEDLSLEARQKSDRASALVLTLELANSWLRTDITERANFSRSLRELLKDVEQLELSRTGLRERAFEWVDENIDLLNEKHARLLEQLRKELCEPLIDDEGTAFGIVFYMRRPRPGDLGTGEGSLQRTVEVGLEEHSHGVADYAERMAQGAGLPKSLVGDLRLAGLLHDLGKADPRFQDRLGWDGQRLLAKGESFDRTVSVGARHECYSVALVQSHPWLLDGATDGDLVRYLIGTHHGRGRGLQPIKDDEGTALELQLNGRKLSFVGRPELDALDSGWPELFCRLQAKYGAWGLAFLETILRLADHRRSEAELMEVSQ